MHKNDRDYAISQKFDEILEKLDVVKGHDFRPVINLYTIDYTLNCFV